MRTGGRVRVTVLSVWLLLWQVQHCTRIFRVLIYSEYFSFLHGWKYFTTQMKWNPSGTRSQHFFKPLWQQAWAPLKKSALSCCCIIHLQIHDNHKHWMKHSFSLQAEGSSFLQMGVSLEQQVNCIFKVWKCIMLKLAKTYFFQFWGKKILVH